MTTDISVRFKLLKPEADAPTQIRLFYYSTELFPRRRRLVWGTGQRVHPMLWNAEAMRPHTSGNAVGKYVRAHKLSKDRARVLKARLKVIKEKLERIDQAIEAFAIEAFAIGAAAERPRPAPAVFRQHLNEKFRNAKPTSLAFVAAYLRAFIDDIRSGRRRILSGRRKGQKYTEGTIKNYAGLLTIWEAFEGHQRRRYAFSDLTIEVYGEFYRYCENKPLTDSHGKVRTDDDGAPLRGLSPNYIGRQVSKLKVIMEQAREDGLHTNMAHHSKKFAATMSDVQDVYLTQSQLDRLYFLDLTHRPTWANVRDIFLVGCYTAQRVSDYLRISSEMIVERDGGQYIELIQKKGVNPVAIPVNPVVAEILERHGGKLPRLANSADAAATILNREIKPICKAAGITERHVASVTEQGSSVERSGPKWEFVKSHTARRTGITLMYLGGMDIKKIALVSGHRELKQLDKYIKATKIEQAQVVASYDFFQRQPATPGRHLKAVG